MKANDIHQPLARLLVLPVVMLQTNIPWVHSANSKKTNLYIKEIEWVTLWLQQKSILSIKKLFMFYMILSLLAPSSYQKDLCDEVMIIFF